MNHKFIYPILFSVIVAACSSGGGGGGNSDSSNAPAGNFAREIAASDFQGVATSIPSTEIRSVINDNSYFLSISADADDELNSVEDIEGVVINDACLESKLGDYAIEEGDNGLYVVTIDNSDLRSCFDFSMPGFTVQIISLYASIYSEVKVLDEFGNPVNVTSQIYQQAIDEQGGWYVAEMLDKLHMYMKIKITQKGQSLTFIADAKFLISDVSGVNEPCQFDFATRMIDDCVIRTAMSFEFVGYPSEDEFITETLLFNDIVESEGGTFYTNGSIDFEIANWNGVMSYDLADPEVAPTYNVSNGFTSLNDTYQPGSVTAMSTVISKTITSTTPKISSKLRVVRK